MRIIEAMRKAKVKWLVVISAAFAANTPGFPLWFRAENVPLTGIFRQMAAMERVLRAADDIEWTAVRPGWPLNRAHTGDFEVSDKGLPSTNLRTLRADLAQFMLDCATHGW